MPFQAPYGYKNQDSGAVVQPEEAILVKQIFDKRIAGLSFSQIADDLNSLGIRSRGRKMNGVMTI